MSVRGSPYARTPEKAAERTPPTTPRKTPGPDDLPREHILCIYEGGVRKMGMNILVPYNLMRQEVMDVHRKFLQRSKQWRLEAAEVKAIQAEELAAQLEADAAKNAEEKKGLLAELEALRALVAAQGGQPPVVVAEEPSQDPAPSEDVADGGKNQDANAM
jgi:hypothetical protein